MQDPSRFLDIQSITPRCIVHPSRAAVVDMAHEAMVGHDVFFFSDERSRAAFLRNPLRYCRALTDPVTLQRFRPGRRSPAETFRGRLYYFQSDSTHRVFAAMPDSFALRRGM